MGQRPASEDVQHYGPFLGAGRLQEGVKVLNDLLGLRDCALRMPMLFAEQGDLFAPERRAGCLRHELGNCTGPCGGLVTEVEYRQRVDRAIAFIEGRQLDPLDHVIDHMTTASEQQDFERATWWRSKFEALTWLLGACSRVQASLDALSFVYVEPGAFGDDRAYVIRRALVRAAAPAPTTPIEIEAFRALVAEHAEGDAEPGPIPPSVIDETLLVLRWFRTRPTALRRTTPLAAWLAQHPPAQDRA